MTDFDPRMGKDDWRWVQGVCGVLVLLLVLATVAVLRSCA